MTENLQQKRIQRKRTKGWHMPENAVYVGRPSKWGNPFKGDEEFECVVAISAYEDWVRKNLSWDSCFLDSLKGKDLACWCPLNKPCHADVLLKFLRELKTEEQKP